MDSKSDGERFERPGISFKMPTKKEAALGILRAASGLTLYRQVAGAVSSVAGMASMIGWMVRNPFRRREPVRETFPDAQSRLRLSDAAVIAIRDSFARRGAWWFVAFLAGFATLAYAPFAMNSKSQALLASGVMIMTAAKTITWRFRYCQVRDRDLYAFGDWFCADPWVRRAYVAVVSILTLGLLIFSATAHAQGVTLQSFTPPAGDTSVSYLREIYGSIIDTIHAGGDTQGGQPNNALGAMLIPFNSAVMFLGMVFVAYTIVKGTMDTAHDGELLGRKMSDVWVPIRTVGGTAFLLPLGSGYCLVQIAVLWLAIQSAGVADYTLSAGLDYVAETGMVSRPNLPDSRALAAQIFKAEVCMAAMNKQYQDSNDPTRIVETTKTWVVHNGGEAGIVDVGAAAAAGAVAGPVGAIASLGVSIADRTYTVQEIHWAATDGSNKQCGSIKWHESEQSSMGAGNADVAKGPILAAHGAAIRQMISEMQSAAQQIVDSGQAPQSAFIANSATAYENAIAAAAKSAIQNSSSATRANFLQYAKDGGWIYLPAYYNQLIQLNDAVQSAINTLPSVESPNIEDQVVVDYALQNYRDYMTVANEYLKRRDLSATAAGDAQAAEDNSLPTSWESAKRFLSRPAQVATYKFTQQIAGSNLSHVGQIKAVGDTISHAAEALSAVVFAASGVAGSNAVRLTVGNAFDVGAALSSISGVLSTIITALFVFGAWAAYYIPMIPFIASITAIIKWFVMVFEMVIAAPIMAAAHVHPDGDDLVGKAGPAYMLILSLVMWPVLTVFGFFGSIWLAQPVTGLVNTLYMPAVMGAEHNSFTGLVAFVAYTSIYVIIMTGVVHSVFTLVNWLPSNALRVIGGALGAHGIADGELHEAMSKFYGGAANFQNRATPERGTNPDRPKAGEGKEKKGPSNSDLLG